MVKIPPGKGNLRQKINENHSHNHHDLEGVLEGWTAGWDWHPEEIGVGNEIMYSSLPSRETVPCRFIGHVDICIGKIILLLLKSGVRGETAEKIFEFDQLIF